MKRFLVLVCFLSLTGCALRGTYEVAGVKTADALSETYPADAERFATQAALELSRRYPAGQTGLCLVTVPGMFGSALETNLRGSGFAILPVKSASGVKVGYVLDEIAGELHPTGYLQIATSDGTSFSMVRRLLGGLPTSAVSAPSPLLPVSAPEEAVPGTPVLLPQNTAPVPPAVPERPLRESVPQAAKSVAPASAPTKDKTPVKALPIITAVRTIIPVGWQYRIHGTELRAAVVPYPRNVAWRIALTDIATATGSQVVIDGKGKVVTFTPKGMQQEPSLPVPQAAAPSPENASTARSESPAVAKALHEATAETSSPAAPTPTAVTQPQIAASPVPSTPAVTIVAEPMLPEWRLTPGSLRAQLEAWTKRADYQLVWSADTDLDMQSRASFRGNFVGAITQLFEGLHAAGFPLTATIYQTNNVLEVGNK